MRNPFILLSLFMSFLGMQSIFAQKSDTLHLEGNWRFEIDAADVGTTAQWFSRKLKDNIILPGSMLTNNKGNDITIKTQWTGSIYDSSFYFNPRFEKYRRAGDVKFPFWLTPEKEYVGAAWYQKEITIPKDWDNKHIYLYLERPHTETLLYLDAQKIGMQNSMVAPHQYELSSYLTPGTYTLSIRVDNRIKDINVGPDSHSLTDHTQGNWNGIIGKLKLIATPETYIEDIQAYPDRTAKEVRFKVAIAQLKQQAEKLKLNVELETFNITTTQKLKPYTASFKISSTRDTLFATIPLGEKIALWDEFDPALYRAKVTLSSSVGIDQQVLQFGIRDFKTKATSFLINDRPVFLRGTLDNAIYPLSGHPPMDVDSWTKVFKTIKDHGLNHVRYHSWCPPEAAFKAADLVGIYLQPEGPSWANHGSALGLGRPIDTYIYEETNRMETHYGNYASYVMLAYGNEPTGRQVEYLSAFNEYWKQRDNRRLYTGASVGGSWPIVPNNEFMVRGGARGLDWKNETPQTRKTFTKNIAQFEVPFVSHELGQYCVFPNFKETEKYSGPLKAKNFELFEEDLADHHMLDQADDFFMASGKLQALCYKYDIEKALRTPNYSGYQMLSLSDYSGQGTALVGMLDAFWDPKPYIDATAFREFANTTVPLAELPKFVYTNDELFTATALVSHYGRTTLNANQNWQITNEEEAIVASGDFNKSEIGFGLSTLGEVKVPLSEIKTPQKLTLTIAIENTEFKNHWDFWVYPKELPAVTTQVYECTSLDKKALKTLNAGGTVLLNAAGKIVKGAEVIQTFIPVFWNTSWFQMRPPHTTGILIDPEHPLFKEFPTEYHSDLQWYSIVNKQQVMHLEDFPANFKPLIQPIDTWFMNRRLAMAFEAKVGNGKLMVVSVDLNDPEKDAAAHQLYYSLQKYMASAEFNPKNELHIALIEDLFENPSKQQFDKYTNDSPDELKPKNKGK
tara:strand:+ start:24019 stop:26907 length:2889 start_codon:yes stop_codon:yes gene_type:complete